MQAVSERLELQDVNVESSSHKMTVMQQGLCWGRTITSRVRSMGCISASGGGGQSICWLSELLDSLTACGKSSGFGFLKLPPDETNKRWTENVTVSLSLLAGSLVPVRNWAIFTTTAELFCLKQSSNIPNSDPSGNTGTTHYAPEKAVTFSLARLSLLWKKGTVKIRMRCSGFTCSGHC